MDDWTTETRPGYRTKTIRRGPCTIIIHRPLLSKEEAAKRERQVQEAMEREMRGYINRKEKKA